MSPPGKQEMGKDGKNGFDACAKGTVQGKCAKDRGLAGFEKSLAEGSTIGNAHADIFHEPGRKRAQSIAAGGTQTREIFVIETNQATPGNSRNRQ